MDRLSIRLSVILLHLKYNIKKNFDGYAIRRQNTSLVSLITCTTFQLSATVVQSKEHTFEYLKINLRIETKN